MSIYSESFIKTLTASDVNPDVSNQHELHGVKELENIFGVIPIGQAGKTSFNATIRLGNQGERFPIELTWYNSRASSQTRHEYRLYYSSTNAYLIQQLNAGDDMLIGITEDNDIEIIVYKNQNSGISKWTSTNALQTGVI